MTVSARALLMSSRLVEITKLAPEPGAELNPPSPTVTVEEVDPVMYRISQLFVLDPFFHRRKRPSDPLGLSPELFWMTVVVLPEPL